MDIFREIVLFEQDVVFQKLPQIFVSGSVGSTMPSVENLTRLVFKNTSPVSVSLFANGIEGQEVKVLGDGNTTILNGAGIKTNTGADKLLAAEMIYSFTLLEGVWYESN